MEQLMINQFFSTLSPLLQKISRLTFITIEIVDFPIVVVIESKQFNQFKMEVIQLFHEKQNITQYYNSEKQESTCINSPARSIECSQFITRGIPFLILYLLIFPNNYLKMLVNGENIWFYQQKCYQISWHNTAIFQIKSDEWSNHSNYFHLKKGSLKLIKPQMARTFHKLLSLHPICPLNGHCRIRD